MSCSNCRILRQGNLKLKGHGMVKDSWRKYYFVLTDTPSLVYYKNEGELSNGTSLPVGSIAISEAVQVCTFTTKANQHGVRIAKANGVDEVRCATELDAKEWARLLSDVSSRHSVRVATPAPGDGMDFNQLYAMRPKAFEADMMSNHLVGYVGPCILEMTIDDLVVWKKEGKQQVCLVKWNLSTLRKYSFNEVMFELETGRRSATGEGVVVFRTKHGAEMNKRMKLAARYKKSQTQTQQPPNLQKHQQEIEQNSSRKEVAFKSNDTVDNKAVSVSKSSHEIATLARRHNKQLRRSRSVDDLQCGPLLLVDSRSPGAATRVKPMFTPYHALHHLPAESRPKHLDRYHHLEVNLLKPGTAEKYDNTDVKSNTRLPYHHLHIDKQQDNSLSVKESENVAGNSDCIYQNFQFTASGHESADTVDKNERHDVIYANVSSSRTFNPAPQHSDDLMPVQLPMPVQPNENKVHKCSGDKNDQISPLYENLKFSFGSKDADNAPSVEPLSGGHYPAEWENQTSESDMSVKSDVLDAESHAVYANIPMERSNDLVQSNSDEKSATKRLTEEQRSESIESGDYSYPTIRSAREYFRKDDHTQPSVNSGGEECHYYGLVYLKDDALYEDEAFTEINAQKISTSQHQNSPSIGVCTVPGSSSPFLPFVSLSASTSPNTSRPASPREALCKVYDNELLLQPGRRSPVRQPVISDDLKNSESQKFRRPRAYQMDRGKNDKKTEHSRSIPDK